MDKFLNLIGFEEVRDEEEGAEEEDSPAPAHTPGARGRRPQLVSLPGPRAVRVVVVEPRSFDEVQSIADHLKAKRPVILNLEAVEKDLAQKFLNFLSGTIYALDGSMQRVGNSIFLFAPSNVEVSGQLGALEGGARSAALLGR